MKVAVYRNLHNGMFSIQCREGENYGRVICHSKSVRLKNVSFVVRENGRQKVIREQKKNVHAFVVGELDGIQGASVPSRYMHLSYELGKKLIAPEKSVQDGLSGLCERIFYNPYTARKFSFMGKQGFCEVDKASHVYMDVKDGVYARIIHEEIS